MSGRSGERAGQAGNIGGLPKGNPAPLLEGVVLDLALRFTAGGHRVFALVGESEKAKGSQAWPTGFSL